MTWTPIEIPPVRDAAATPYGYVIDHIWAEPGSNAARRPHWPEEMFISVEPCEDLDEVCEANGNVGAMTCWVFVTYWAFPESQMEYGALDDDCAATDWLVGRVE
jgi:hypothetical protein